MSMVYEDKTGLVHIVPDFLCGGEFTICGFAIEAIYDEYDNSGIVASPTKHKPSCPTCIKYLTEYAKMAKGLGMI